MGYQAHMAQSSFRIDAACLAPALNALKTLTASNKSIRDWRLHANERALFEALEAFGWIVEVAPDGSICTIGYESDKMGFEEEVLAAIAPWVDEGSFIEMVGEDSERWRWVFSQKSVQHIAPKQLWA